MRRIFVWMIVLCLCFNALAFAEISVSDAGEEPVSLFPEMPAPTPAPAIEETPGDDGTESDSFFPLLPTATPVIDNTAPSYGGMAKVKPSNVQDYPGGGQLVTYDNVSEQGYSDFGVYLKKLGYRVTASNIVNRTVELQLTDGRFNIGLVYYGDEHRMALVYEEGVDFETSDLKIGKVYGGDPWTVSACDNFSIYLKKNGTVVTTFNNKLDWEDIVAVTAGFGYAVGLKRDGTVVAAITERDKDNHYIEYGQRDVGDWRDIVAISAGLYHTVGLRRDGTVVAVGCNEHGECDVGDWRDIAAISAGSGYTVGLKRDGTVVAVGLNSNGKCDVGDWTGIVGISARGLTYTLGLRDDGTVVAVGDNRDGRCDVGGWRNIVQVCGGRFEAVGLKSDGTAVATGENRIEKYFVDGAAVYSAYSPKMLKVDGTVVGYGNPQVQKNILVPERD